MVYTYLEKKYPTVRELLKEHTSEVSTSTVQKRLDAGWSVEDAINKPKSARLTGKLFTFKGKSYGSLSGLHAANKESIPVSSLTFIRRVEAGWSIEKAAKEPKGVKPNATTYTYKDKTYGTLRSVFVENKADAKCSWPVFNRRVMEEGLSIADALVADKKKTGAPKYGPHTVEGVEYETLLDVAEEYSVNPNTMYQRYNRGKRNEELVLKRERKDYKPTEVKKERKQPAHVLPVTYKGVDYVSTAALLKEYGVKHCTYRDRLKRGLTIGQALGDETVVDGRSLLGTKYEVGGEKLTIKQMSERFDVPEVTIRDRLARGASLEDALSHGKIIKGKLSQRKKYGQRKKVSLVVDGVEYSGYKALGEAYGLKQYVVRERIVKHGWTPEEAVKKQGKSKSLVIDGVKYDKLNDVSEKFGISQSAINRRLDDGWTPEEAVNLMTHESLVNIEYQGNKYTSIKALSEAVGITTGKLTSRFNNGYTVEEAVAMGSESIKSSGRYNLTILERDPELTSKPSLVYFIAILIDGETKYKVGITTQTVKERFSSLGYPYREITTAGSTLIECYKLEQELHGMLDMENDKDIDGSVLEGYTEIFNLDNDQVDVVSDLISNWHTEQNQQQI